MEQKFVYDAMHNQPVINIGMTGHVSNGKSTLTGVLSGVATQRYASEKKQNITIRLGYANAKIYKCGVCEAPMCYQSTSSAVFDHNCKICGIKTQLITHVSFIDVPGHGSLMSTMLNGTCIMDYTILVESAINKIIPAPQTKEHYKITKKANIPTKIVCLNKVDLSTKAQSTQIINDLRTFFEKHGDGDVPILPISGTLNINTDVLCEYISQLPIPIKNLEEDFKMLIIRSFNINTPQTEIANLNGGVIGGGLERGKLHPGDEVTIYPGFIREKEKVCPIEVNSLYKLESEWEYKPLHSVVQSIKSDENVLQYAIPGGLIGVQLDIDPAMTGSDKLVGQVVFRKNKSESKFKIYETLDIDFVQHLFDDGSQFGFIHGTSMNINVNSNNITCRVLNATPNEIKNGNNTCKLSVKLYKPVCVELNDHVSINLPADNGGIFIVGFGNIINGEECSKF